MQALPKATVDVVVVSYNSRTLLPACVSAFSGLDGVAVIVVDNASSDGSADEAARLGARAIELGANRGFAYGCNVGWRAGRAPFVLFLNPDARIDPGSLTTLVHVLDEPGVAVAAPRIVEADGSLDLSQRRFPRLRSTYANALFLHRAFRRASWASELVRDDAAYSTPSSPEWTSGACLLVRRSALERLGGWDEGFFLYCEDKDLCKRARDAGFDVRYHPDAVATHVGGASAPRTSLYPVLTASRVRYARKHHGALYALLERIGIALGSLTHVALGRGGVAARRAHFASLIVAATWLRPDPAAGLRLAWRSHQ